MTTTPQRLTARGRTVLALIYTTLLLVGLGVAGATETDQIPLSVGFVGCAGVAIVMAAIARIVELEGLLDR